MNNYGELLKIYSEKYRQYHNYNHIFEMLSDYSENRYYFNKTYGDKLNDNDIFTAIWYHDVVYIPGAKDNEDLSAQKYIDDFRPYGYKESICEAIMHTKDNHGVKSDNYIANIICDLDLFGLVHKYWDNKCLIFDEYCHYHNLDDSNESVRKELNNKRLKWLELFVMKESFFIHDRFKEYNDKVRHDILHEINQYESKAY